MPPAHDLRTPGERLTARRRPSIRARIERNLPLLFVGGVALASAVMLLSSRSSSHIGLLPSWSYLAAIGAITLSGGALATVLGYEEAESVRPYSEGDPGEIVVSRAEWESLRRRAAGSSESGPGAGAELWNEEERGLPELPSEALAANPAPPRVSPTPSPPAPAAPPPTRPPPVANSPTAIHPPVPATPPPPELGIVDEELDRLFSELNIQANAPAPAGPTARRSSLACGACQREIPPSAPRGVCENCFSAYCLSCRSQELAVGEHGKVCRRCRAAGANG